MKMNHVGIFIVAVTTAVVAIKELCSWMDKAADRQHKLKISNIQESTARMTQAQNIRELAKEYAALKAKQKLSNQESLRMREVAKQLAEITNMPIGNVDKATGKIVNRTKNFLDGAKEIAAIKEEDLEHNKKVLEQLESAEMLIAEMASKYNDSIAWNFEEKLEGFALLPRSLKTVTSTKDQLAKVREEIKNLKTNILETERGIAALKDLSQEDFTRAPEPEKEAENKNAKDELKDLKESQENRLKALDSAYKAEKQIIEKRNIDAAQKKEELKTAEQKYYGERAALLETFHNENLQKGLSYAQSELRIVGDKGESIKAETEKTNEALSRIADEKHKKEIEEINSTAEKTKKAVEDEIALKKELGQIEGNSEKEKERNEHLAKSQSYLQKQNELMEEYLKLINSSNEKDREKAFAIKKQAETLGKAAEEEAKKAENAFEKMASKAAQYMQAAGNAIVEVFSSIAEAAKAAINNKEAERKRKTALELAQIEREKNQTLLEIDNELSQRREQKQIEDAEREEQRRNEEYEKRLAESERDIQELEGKFEAETNLEKLKYLEKQLEQERKKKAEDAARKKEEDEKRKRDKEARVYEITLLNAKNRAEHEFSVARIQTENAAGDAAAKAAQQAAKWQKAQGVISMSIKSAEQTALAAIAIARALGGDPSGAVEAPARIAAAAAAIVQGGIIAGQPSPPDYIQQPLPPAPRPIKFAKGGIVMPSRAGTGITLPNGNAGLVAEAGLPELILPINPPNLENVFKAAGVNQQDNSKSFSYSPSYKIEISQNRETGIEETLLNVLRENDREVLNIIKNGEQNWQV